jgi:hypothetical protein
VTISAKYCGASPNIFRSSQVFGAQNKPSAHIACGNRQFLAGNGREASWRKKSVRYLAMKASTTMLSMIRSALRSEQHDYSTQTCSRKITVPAAKQSHGADIV